MLVPIIVAALFFVQFFLKESSETKANLPKACLLMVLSVAISIAYLLLVAISAGTLSAFIPALVQAGLTGALWFYGKTVCQRFADA
mmetsp:Transcript_16058/g.27083  ORF Transcript_16058/g.27083 Transcript_16058/m.27083 type:complete len:86 (+) Transcript_16058:322-579(+)